MFFTWCLAVKSTWIQLGALGIGCRSCVLIFSIPMMPKKSCGISFFTSKMRVFAWEYSWGTAKRFIHGDKDWERETWMENTDCGRRSHLERTFFLLFLDFSLSWFFTRWDLLGSQIIHGLIFQIIYLSWSAIGVSPGVRFNGCGGKKRWIGDWKSWFPGKDGKVLFIEIPGRHGKHLQGVDSLWGEEGWELIGMEFGTVRSEVEFQDCKCREKDGKKLEQRGFSLEFPPKTSLEWSHEGCFDLPEVSLRPPPAVPNSTFLRGALLCLSELLLAKNPKFWSGIWETNWSLSRRSCGTSATSRPWPTCMRAWSGWQDAPRQLSPASQHPRVSNSHGKTLPAGWNSTNTGF